MTCIYSSLPPTHEMPREPINAKRAREGMRPLCWNRPDFPPPMSPECHSWSVHPQEDLATESIPGREGWRCWGCWGCRHLPEDPRVIERAKQAEEA